MVARRCAIDRTVGSPRRHHQPMTDLKTRIRAGETLIGVFSDLASPLAAELCGQAGFDWIVLDLEHGAATDADLLALLYAVGTTPMAPLVRVPVRGAPARRARARPRGGRDHAPAAPVGRRGPGGGPLPALSAGRAARRRVAHPRRRHGGPRPCAMSPGSSTSASSGSSRSSRPATVAASRGDRRIDRGRRPVRRPGRPVARPGCPGSVRRRRLPRRRSDGGRRLRAPRQGRRHPHLRRGRAAAPPRARVHASSASARRARS